MSSPVPPTQDQMLQIILSKLTNLQVGMSIFSIENGHRIEEIVQLGKRIGISESEETDDAENVITFDSEDFDGIESENRGIRVNIGGNAQIRTNIADESQDTARQRTQLTASRNTTFGTIPAKEIIRAIRTLTGHDNIGVEDFIRSVERAQAKRSQPDLILDFILAEKITQNAERAIRYLEIKSFSKLYDALRKNLNLTGSVSALRSKLESCRQGYTETVQNFNGRSRKAVNKLKYTVQSEHSNSAQRRTVFPIEEKESLKRYMLNLRREIGPQVKAQKPRNLCKAQNQAAEMEMWLKESQPTRPLTQAPMRIHPRVLTRSSIPSTKSLHAPPASRNRPFRPVIPNSNMPLQEKTQMTCHKCGKLGHIATEYYAKAQNFPLGQLLCIRGKHSNGVTYSLLV